jgi:hypothetical protein
LSEFIKIVLVIALSSVKFLGGPALAYHYRLNFVEIILYTVAGGMLGVVVISYFSPWIMMGWEWIRNFFRHRDNHIYAKPTLDLKGNIRIKYTYVSANARKKPLFTPMNRRIVRIFRKYGLLGIAVLTPVILSIPIGTFFATRLANSREKVFLYMFISILLWSVLITSVLYNVIPLPEDIISKKDIESV